MIGQGACEQATIVLDQLPDGAKCTTGVRFRRARLALLDGDHAGAEALLRSIVSEGDDAPAVLHDLAFCLLCLRRPEDARTIWESMSQAHATGVEWSLLRARTLLMLGDRKAACEELDAALVSHPEHADLHGLQALARLDNGDTGGANTAAERALSRRMDQHEALIVAGTLALWARDGERALACFERALVRHPGSGRALSGLGQALMFRHDVDGARRTLQRAVDAMPDHIGTWHALAWTQLLQGDRDAADVSYRAAYALDRNFGDTHGGMGLIAALRGDLDEADACVRRALRLDPNAATARYAKALVARARGDDATSDLLIEELTMTAGVEGSLLPAAQLAERLHMQMLGQG